MNGEEVKDMQDVEEVKDVKEEVEEEVFAGPWCNTGTLYKLPE